MNIEHITPTSLEQGNLTISGTSSSTTVLRSSSFMTFSNVEYEILRIRVNANTSVSNKKIQFGMVGYNSSSVCLFYQRWFDLNSQIDFSEASGCSTYNTPGIISSFKIVLRYSDDSTITPSEISNLSIDFLYKHFYESDITKFRHSLFYVDKLLPVAVYGRTYTKYNTQPAFGAVLHRNYTPPSSSYDVMSWYVSQTADGVKERQTYNSNIIGAVGPISINNDSWYRTNAEYTMENGSYTYPLPVPIFDTFFAGPFANGGLLFKAFSMIDQEFDLSTWKYNASFTKFDNEFNDETKASTLHVIRGNNSSRIFFPFRVYKDEVAIVEFDYNTPTGFNVVGDTDEYVALISRYSSSNNAVLTLSSPNEENDNVDTIDNAQLQPLTDDLASNQLTALNDLSSLVKIPIEHVASNTPKHYRMEYRSDSDDYINLVIDFGYMEQDVETTMCFSNFSITYKKIWQMEDNGPFMFNGVHNTAEAIYPPYPNSMYRYINEINPDVPFTLIHDSNIGNSNYPPYPDTMWRIEKGYNDGLPFNRIMSNIPHMTSTDWEDVENLPSINGIDLLGDITIESLGLHEMSNEMLTNIIKETFGCIL